MQKIGSNNRKADKNDCYLKRITLNHKIENLDKCYISNFNIEQKKKPNLSKKNQRSEVWAVLVYGKLTLNQNNPPKARDGVILEQYT